MRSTVLHGRVSNNVKLLYYLYSKVLCMNFQLISHIYSRHGLDSPLNISEFSGTFLALIDPDPSMI